VAVRHTDIGLRGAAWWLAAILIIAALLVLRRPDAVVNAQFYAEDGAVWFQQAYNDGPWRSLFSIHAGYLQVLSRLAAAVALVAPLSRAPLVENVIALLVEAAPALFLLSSRMRNLGSLPLRCWLALVYLIVPSAAEVHSNITNAPFNLALLAFLIAIAEAPESRTGAIFDALVLLLMGLTGPFCILLFPVVLLVAATRRKLWDAVRLSVISVGAVVQGLALLLRGHERTHQHLGASFRGICRIVAGQVVLPVVQGRNRLDALTHSYRSMELLACVLTGLAVLLLGYAAWRGSLELRSFILFATLLFAAALAFPTPNPSPDHWGPMQVPGAAARYWFIPELAVMSALLWLLGKQRPAALRVFAALLVCAAGFAATKHWQYPSPPDLHFAEYAQQFENLASGSRMVIPLNPAGWSMTLVKR